MLGGTAAPGGEASAGEGTLSCPLIPGTLHGTHMAKAEVFTSEVRIRHPPTVAYSRDRQQNDTSWDMSMPVGLRSVALSLMVPALSPASESLESC